MALLLNGLGELQRALALAEDSLKIYTEIRDVRSAAVGELLQSLRTQSWLRTKLNRLISKYPFSKD